MQQAETHKVTTEIIHCLYDTTQTSEDTFVYT